MKRGLIVYNEIDRERNIWFIAKLLELLNDESFSLSYVDEKELINYVSNHEIDYVIYRARNYQLLEELEKRQIITFNNSLTNKVANDKLLTAFFLKENNIKNIPTFQNLKSMSFPCVMKSRHGHGGKEVFLLKSPGDATSLNNEYIYQPFIVNQGDIRVYVLNHQALAAVKRTNHHDFRSNFSLGGEVSLYPLDQELKQVATKISHLLDASFIGVDFLLTKNGYLVNEIEDPVGSRMLYQVSDIDIIKLLVDFIKNRLKAHQ